MNRECTCPPWVIRCGHSATGRVVQLDDIRLTHFAWQTPPYDTLPRYGVRSADPPNLNVRDLSRSDDLGEAEAAFALAEQTLLAEARP